MYPADGTGEGPVNDDFLPAAPGPQHAAFGWVSASDFGVDLPLDCEAYINANYPKFAGFAFDVLKDEEAARALAQRLLTEIAVDWDGILRTHNSETVGFDLLIEAVITEAYNRRLDTDALITRAHGLLAQMRRRMMDQEPGLFSGLSRLSMRDFSILILRSWYGRSSFFIAWLLKTSPSTVDRRRHIATAQVEAELRALRLLQQPGRPTDDSHTTGEQP